MNESPKRPVNANDPGAQLGENEPRPMTSDPRCPPPPDPYSGSESFPAATSFADLANPNNLSLGDKLIAFRQFARLIADDTGQITESDQPLPHLSHTAWRTVHDKLNEIVSVRDFGAVGNGITDDTDAIQAAMDYATAIGVQSQSSNLPSGFGNGVSYTTVTVLFPTGRYQIKKTINVNSGIKLQGDGFAAIRGSRGSDAMPLLRLGGQHNWIDGLVFIGGLHHILFFGSACNPSTLEFGGWGAPTNAVSLFKITNCMFKYAEKEAIKFGQDLTSNAVNGHLVVENFDFEGSRFFSGTGDTVTFSNGQAYFDCQATGSTNLDFDVACWTSGGSLALENIRIVGANISAESRAALIRGTGIIYCNNIRLGEMNCTAIRTQANVGLGVPTDVGKRPVVLLHNSYFAAEQKNWMEIYDQFPTVIDVRNMYPPYFNGSHGIYVDANTIPFKAVLEILNSHNFDVRLDIQDNLIPLQGRIRYATDPDPVNDIGIDLAPYLRQYTKSEPPHSMTRSLENLFLPGEVDVRFGPWGLRDSRVTWGTPDTTTGYTITPTLNATTSAVNFGALMTADWGASMSEGEYVFSLYIKSNFAGTVYFTVINTGGQGSNNLEHHVARRPLAGSAIPGVESEYQRLWFNFYHPAASTQRIAFVMYQVPPNAILYAGLFAIHRGISPAPYKRPGNITNEDYMCEIGYSDAPPRTGTYKVGDIIYNTRPDMSILVPPDSHYVGWICMEAGTPGRWAGFGRIEV